MMCNYVKKEIYLEEDPEEDVAVEASLDTDVVKEEYVKAHKCRLCPEGFPSYRELRIHYASHSGLKCIVCSTIFKTKGACSIHYLEKHSDEAKLACELCGKRYMHKSRLKQHMERHGKERNHKCNECDSSFKTKGDLTKHISLLHSTETPYQRKTCLKTSPTLSFTKGHSATLNKESPLLEYDKAMVDDSERRFLCDVCGEKFVNTSNLKDHMERRHSKDRNHKCTECESTFKTKGDLTKHVKIVHPAETPFQCKVCSKSFSTLSLLDIHSVSHNEEKPYQCDQCSIAYKRKNSLNIHKAVAHASKGRVPCEECGKKFKSRIYLNEHMKRGHSATKNHKNISDPICKVCLETFPTSSLLEKHSANHNEEKPYTCDQCCNSYKRKPSLDYHKAMVHDDNGRFACEVCGKKFVCTANLKEHMERCHSKEKKYKCSECGSTFRTKRDLRQHIGVLHPAETPFQCEVCSKSFSKFSYLKLHFPTHSEDRPFKCEFCPKEFKSNRNLNHHQICKHGAPSNELNLNPVEEVDMVAEVKVEPVVIYDPEEKRVLSEMDMEIKREPEVDSN